ncbi:MAG: hypothetical protein ACK4VO_13115 [Pseudobdellovibrio sp.]
MNPFVNPPFLLCPRCKEKYFGILGIQEFGYHRRCAKCNYPKPQKMSTFFPLPEVNKTIIYLDQNILSGMVKSLHPDRRKSIDSFYFEAFKQLDRLSKFQLIVCPDSEYHESESIFSSYPDEHKRVYELLSHGISYYDTWTILRFEMSEQLQKWLKSQPMGETDIPTQRVVHGKINTWQERLLITVNSKRMEMAKNEIARSKSDTFKILQGLFAKWEADAGKNFNHWYRDEISQWPALVINAFNDHQKTMANAISGEINAPLSILPTPLYIMFYEISDTIWQKSSNQEEYKKKLGEFMVSASFEKVPFVRIFSMIMATFGSRISSGNMNKENLEPSMFNDAMMVSTILPFCDAIFLEKQMAGFLRDNPLKKSLANMPKIFSLSNKSAFLDYLYQLESSASTDHLAAVKEVYGENWPTPFTSVLKEYKSKK